MSDKPTLLRRDTHAELAGAVLADLQMTKLFSEYAQSVFLHPCGKTEIQNRQELFRFMQSGANEEALASLLSALRDYEHTLYLENENRFPIERLYLRLRMMRQYAEICGQLAAFTGCGVLLSEMSGYFGAPEKAAVCGQMSADCEKAAMILSSIDTFDLSFTDAKRITPDKNSVSLIDKISACAAKLNLSSPAKKERREHPDLSLCDAYFRLFADKISRINALLAAYAEVDWQEPAAYIPELAFFLKIQALIRQADSVGVPNCLPQLSPVRQLTAKRLYDISLLSKECRSIIPNDTQFSEKEPFFFLTGANGGGKTTYLRAVGINLLLALAGCPVFAEHMTVYPFSGVLTHFPADERFTDSGRLDEESARVGRMLAGADGDTFLLFNETFSGTDDKRGFELLRKTVMQISTEKRFGLFVTHFYEAEGVGVPVLFAQVDEGDGNRRTFRIVRKVGASSSYASDILKKYRLDRESLNERRTRNGI